MSRRKELTTLLPELQKISIYQSNRVTNARYDFTMLQERVFTWVMYFMQAEIKKVMNGTPVGQLSLFSPEVESEFVAMQIPLSYMGRSDQYADIRANVEKLATIAVKMKNDRQDHTIVTGLFSAIKIPGEGKRSPFLTVQMRKDVAAMLIAVDRGADGKPNRYTSYMLHVAATCKNKYTSRMYKLLSSWRDKGGWAVSLQELREMLQLGEKNYANYGDFKKWVLLPVQEELKKIGDIWFNCREADFEVKDGKKVTGLKFKIIKEEKKPTGGVSNKQIAHLHQLCRTLFNFHDKHCEEIQPIFHSGTDFEAVVEKVRYLQTWMLENRQQARYPAAIVVKALLKDFAPGS